MSSVAITIRAIDLASSPLKNIGGSLKGLRSTMLGLGAAFASMNLGSGFIEANSQLEQMKIRLKSILGTSEMADKSFDWIKKFQKENPVLELKDMTKGFIELLNAGVNPTKDGMDALVGATAKYGLAPAQMKLVMKAWRQMGALSNAQRQELNQLAEQVPMVEQKIRAELGLTGEEFRRQMKNREISSKQVSDAMITIFKEGGAEAVKDFASSWQGGISKLKTAWFELMTELGAAGAFDAAKRGIDLLTGAVSNVRLWAHKANEEIKYTVTLMNHLAVGVGQSFKTVFDAVFGGEGGGGVFKKMAHFFIDLNAGVQVVAIGFAEMIRLVKSAFTELANFLMTKFQKVADALGMESPLKKARKELEETKDLLKMLEEQQAMNGQAGIDSPEMKEWRKEIVEIEEKVRLLTSGIYEIDMGKLVKLENYENKIFEIQKRWEEMKKETEGLTIDIPDVIKPPKRSSEGAPEEWQKKIDEVVNSGKEDVKKPATSFTDGWREALTEIEAKFKKSYGSMAAIGKRMAEDVSSAMTNAFEDFFNKVAEGTAKVKDLVQSMLKAIQQMMTRMLAEQASMAVMKLVMSMMGGGGTTAAANSGSNGGMQATSSMNQSGVTYSDIVGVSSKASAGGGMRGKSSVQIINNSGQDLEVTQAESQDSIGDSIMSIVVDRVQRNKGGSRDALKGMLM